MGPVVMGWAEAGREAERDLREETETFEVEGRARGGESEEGWEGEEGKGTKLGRRV